MEAVIILSWGRRIPGLAGIWCGELFERTLSLYMSCLYGCRIAIQNWYKNGYWSFLTRKIQSLHHFQFVTEICLCGNAIPMIPAEVPTVRLYAHTSISRTQSLYWFLSRPPQHQTGPAVDLRPWDGHRFGRLEISREGNPGTSFSCEREWMRPGPFFCFEMLGSCQTESCNVFLSYIAFGEN